MQLPNVTKASECRYADSLYFASGAFARRIESLAKRVWKPSGLPPSQAQLLHFIIDNYFAFPYFISRELQLSPSTITRLTEQLEQKGLAERYSEMGRTYIDATEKGRSLEPVLSECQREFMEQCKRIFGKQDTIRLARLLTRATDKLKESPIDKLNDMDTPGTRRKVEAEYLQKVLSYESYKKLVEDLLAAGKTTGSQQSEAMTHYTQLNMQRMHRLEKTIQILPEVKEAILGIRQPQAWLVLTEGWCGDAAQSIPVMQALAGLNPLITLGLLLRDEHWELMDRYLTNGISRSIPKLIAADPETGEELFNWGPRPAALQQSFYGMRQEGLPYDEIKEELQRWYNKDKTVAVQTEIAALASGKKTL